MVLDLCKLLIRAVFEQWTWRGTIPKSFYPIHQSINPGYLNCSISSSSLQDIISLNLNQFFFLDYSVAGPHPEHHILENRFVSLMKGSLEFLAATPVPVFLLVEFELLYCDRAAVLGKSLWWFMGCGTIMIDSSICMCISPPKGSL